MKAFNKKPKTTYFTYTEKHTYRSVI